MCLCCHGNMLGDLCLTMIDDDKGMRCITSLEHVCCVIKLDSAVIKQYVSEMCKCVKYENVY